MHRIAVVFVVDCRGQVWRPGQGDVAPWPWWVGCSQACRGFSGCTCDRVQCLWEVGVPHGACVCAQRNQDGDSLHSRRRP